jgi:DNA polymerase I-like protein with 3'-5' exonuclease and polymerase domains
MLGVKERTRRSGFVETLLGRKRGIENIASSDVDKRMHAERKAVNTLCQVERMSALSRSFILIECSLYSYDTFRGVQPI